MLPLCVIDDGQVLQRFLAARLRVNNSLDTMLCLCKRSKGSFKG